MPVVAHSCNFTIFDESVESPIEIERSARCAIKQIDCSKPASLYKPKNKGSCIGTNKLLFERVPVREGSVALSHSAMVSVPRRTMFR